MTQKSNAKPSKGDHGYWEAFRKKMSEYKNPIPLYGVKDNIYETRSGHVVGIACSTHPPRRNKNSGCPGWHMTLEKGSFQIAVLRCQADTKDFTDICLPADFFDKYDRRIGRAQRKNSQGQRVRTNKMLFNIVKENGAYMLLDLSDDTIDVSKYVENYDPLR